MTEGQKPEGTALAQRKADDSREDEGLRQPTQTERSTVEIIEAAAEEPKTVFRAASVLARLLNDERVRVPHLMLALTLTPRGIERLGNYNLNKETIRQTCWAELFPIDPPSGQAVAPAFSENVAQIVRFAELKAYTERSEHMSVDDLVQILNATPTRERYQRYWVVQARPDPMVEMLSQTSTLLAKHDRIHASQDKLERATTRLRYLLQLTLLLTGIAAVFVVGVGTMLLLRVFGH